MKLRKINQLTRNRCDIKNNNLYVEYQQQFDYFLNPDVGHKSVKEINQYYIPDRKIERSLKNILSEPMDSVSVMVGYQGIGKSTDIRYTYQINNNSIKFDNLNRAIIFPSFFNGFVLGKITNNILLTELDVRTELTKRIASVCSAIEEEIPELADEFYSSEGKKEFYEFLKHTNPKALIKLNHIMRQSLDEKIDNAKNDDYYIYIVTQLKYYLTRKNCPYNRILIVLDDIESLPYHYQEQLILQYLRFYTCARNLPSSNVEIEKNIYVNLLIAIRPATYKLLRKEQTVAAYSIAREIYKTKSVDMVKYFEKKYSLLQDQPCVEKWNFAYNVLISLSSKFEKKYSEMIKNLVCLDMRKTLKVYYKILSNSFWILKELDGDKDQQEKYIFNNITVIRALSCGSNLVYTNDKDTLIPNILYETTNKEKSILSLYVIAYFIMQRADFWEYGESTVVKEDLIKDFSDVFGEKSKIQSYVSEIVDYLYSQEIISIRTYENISISSTISDSTFLYLSAKGLELWNMLSADSVLMELYREDYYQDINKCDKYHLCSSYDLMEMNKQIVIFEKVYEILIELFSYEKNMIYRCIEDGAYNKYVSIFGGNFMVEHLMIGVDKSIQYSGKKNDNLMNMSDYLKKSIEALKGNM